MTISLEFIHYHTEAETFNYFARTFGIYGETLGSRGI